MEVKNEEKSSYNDRLQNIISNFSKCKKTFVNKAEECKNLKETNTKLITELKETTELEKSHRNHLIASREMIANLQETVSHLVYLKREVKKLKDELISKDSVIDSLEKEKEIVSRKHNEVLMEVRDAQEKKINDLMQDSNDRVQQVQIPLEIQIAEVSFTAEELRSKIKEMENEHKDKMNIIVLEYEKKLQCQASSSAKLQEQATREVKAAQANLYAYQRKFEMLEDKLKQSQFKEYQAQNIYPSQYVGKVDVNMRDAPTQLRRPNQRLGTLQIVYSEGTSEANVTKEPFNIKKKRKLYNNNDFLNQ